MRSASIRDDGEPALNASSPSKSARMKLKKNKKDKRGSESSAKEGRGVRARRRCLAASARPAAAQAHRHAPRCVRHHARAGSGGRASRPAPSRRGSCPGARACSTWRTRAQRQGSGAQRALKDGEDEVGFSERDDASCTDDGSTRTLLYSPESYSILNYSP